MQKLVEQFNQRKFNTFEVVTTDRKKRFFKDGKMSLADFNNNGFLLYECPNLLIVIYLKNIISAEVYNAQPFKSAGVPKSDK